MSGNLKSAAIAEIYNNLVERLSMNQKQSGEFETFAQTRDGNKFYIGESPFVTAHIIYLLHGIDDDRIRKIIDKAIAFLERLDYTGKRIYKYWYLNAVGTAYPFLPFDLDDTAVVNQALALCKRETVPASVALNNVNAENLFYTWLKPSLKTILRQPSYLSVFSEYMKAYSVFTKNSSNPVMAEYNDTEIIVRMNVYLMLAIKGEKVQIADKQFPFLPEDVKGELQTSLHYQNGAMYYLTLAKLQKHLKIFDDKRINELSKGMRIYLKEQITDDGISNVIAMFLSLAFIGELNLSSIGDLSAMIETGNVSEKNFKICVGNKKFEDYHEYFSSDFTMALAIRLLNEI